MQLAFGETQADWENRQKQWKTRFALVPTIIGVKNGTPQFCWFEFYEERMVKASYTDGGNFDGATYERRSVGGGTGEPYQYAF